MVPYCEDCRTSTTATGCPKHSGITFHNPYAGFSLDDDEPLLAEPSSLPPAKGHTMVPKSELDAARALADELALHLDRAIDDLTGDWDETGGPQMNYVEANAALAKWEASRG